MENASRKNGAAPASNGANGKSATNKAGNGKPRRKRRGNANYSTQTMYPHIQANGVTNNTRKNARINLDMLTHGKRISPDGMAFLKCAFAPPDFANSRVQGVPDDFQGKSLVKKHRLITPFNFSSANLDWYIMLVPIPGVAFISCTVAAGTPVLATTVWSATTYSDFLTLFPSSIESANVVDKFRFVSNHIEFVPTVNQANWSGNFQSWKLPVSLIQRPATGATLYSITGLNGVNATNADMYVGPFNLGVYAAAYNAGSTFNFQSVLENMGSVPTTLDVAAGDFGRIIFPLTGTSFTGLDAQFDSTIVKVSGLGPNVTNTAILKTWACVEYQAVTGSSIYEYQTYSPKDALALEIYRKVINELPVGVSFVDNEGFWARVLAIIKGMSGVGMVLPGPYGLAATGVNSLATALQQLTV
jgi:hypothetical protein